MYLFDALLIAIFALGFAHPFCWIFASVSDPQETLWPRLRLPLVLWGLTLIVLSAPVYAVRRSIWPLMHVTILETLQFAAFFLAMAALVAAACCVLTPRLKNVIVLTATSLFVAMALWVLLAFTHERINRLDRSFPGLHVFGMQRAEISFGVRMQRFDQWIQLHAKHHSHLLYFPVGLYEYVLRSGKITGIPTPATHANISINLVPFYVFMDSLLIVWLAWSWTPIRGNHRLRRQFVKP